MKDLMNAGDFMEAGPNHCRKLVLHLDVNNTVFIGDSITKSVTPEETLNEYLSENAWGMIDEGGNWKSAGEMCVKPPDDKMISYYKFAEAKYQGKPRSEFKKHVRAFTDNEMFRPFRKFYDQMIDALEFPGDIKNTNGVQLPSFKGKRGVSYHNIVPSFYKLLENLCKNKRDFAIVYRTFGSDGQAVLQVTKDLLSERHVAFSNQQDTAGSGGLVDNHGHEVLFTNGTITRSSGQITMKCPEGNHDLTNLSDIYRYFSQANGIKLFVGDYDGWKSKNFNSSAGKPLLVDPTDDSVHHIMFDDNFRPWEPEDSIVNVLQAKDGSFVSVDPASFEDVCVVKADLYQSICNRNYFIERIHFCEKNYSKFIAGSKNC